MQETLAWLANPSNANSDGLPPGLEGFDPVPYLSAAVPITLATFGTQLVHELGHRVAAYMRKASLHSRLIRAMMPKAGSQSEQFRCSQCPWVSAHQASML